LKESREISLLAGCPRLHTWGMDTDTLGSVGRPPTELPRELARELRKLARARKRSDDALSRAIVGAVDAGFSQSAIAREVGVTPQAIQQRVRAARPAEE
jgi:hypothetical protein